MAGSIGPGGVRIGGRRLRQPVRAAVVRVAALVAVLVVATGVGAAAATTGPARAAAARAAASGAMASRPSKTPPQITTLGALNRWMNAAVLSKRSASFTHATVVGTYTSDRESGVVTWAKVNEPYFGTAKFVVLPTAAYRWGPWATKTDPGPPIWARVPRDEVQFEVLSQQLNPALMYPRLGSLKVTRSRWTVVVERTRCWVYSVVMTTEQNYGSQPGAVRPTPAALKGGTTTVSFTVDAAGLPHKVVVVDAWPHGSYREVSTFSGWGKQSTVRAPSGPIVG